MSRSSIISRHLTYERAAPPLYRGILLQIFVKYVHHLILKFCVRGLFQRFSNPLLVKPSYPIPSLCPRDILRLSQYKEYYPNFNNGWNNIFMPGFPFIPIFN